MWHHLNFQFPNNMKILNTKTSEDGRRKVDVFFADYDPIFFQDVQFFSKWYLNGQLVKTCGGKTEDLATSYNYEFLTGKCEKLDLLVSEVVSHPDVSAQLEKFIVDALRLHLAAAKALGTKSDVVNIFSYELEEGSLFASSDNLTNR